MKVVVSRKAIFKLAVTILSVLVTKTGTKQKPMSGDVLLKKKKKKKERRKEGKKETTRMKYKHAMFAF